MLVGQSVFTLLLCLSQEALAQCAVRAMTDFHEIRVSTMTKI